MKKLALILGFALAAAGAAAQNDREKEREIVIQKVVVGPGGKTDTIIQRIAPGAEDGPKIMILPNDKNDLPADGRRKIVIEKNFDTDGGGPVWREKKGSGERQINVTVDERGTEKGEIHIEKIIVGPDGKADTIIERRAFDGPMSGEGPQKMFFFEDSDGPGPRLGHRGGQRRGSPFRSEVGLNATNLIAKLARSGGESVGNGSPFAVSYKFFWKNLGLRTAAGWSTISNEESGTPGAGSAITTKSSDRDFRVGLEYQFRVAAKWRAYLGGDYIFGEGSRTVRTFFTDAFGALQSGDIKKIAARQGYGGAVGLQFMLNRNIGIGTEATGYWLRTKNSERDDFAPGEESVETATTSFSVAPPSAIFLYFRF